MQIYFSFIEIFFYKTGGNKGICYNRLRILHFQNKAYGRKKEKDKLVLIFFKNVMIFWVRSHNKTCYLKETYKMVTNGKHLLIIWFVSALSSQ